MIPGGRSSKIDHRRLDLLPLPATPLQLRGALLVAARRAATDHERQALLRVREEVSLWQAGDADVAHLRRSTAARLAGLIQSAGTLSPPLSRGAALVLADVCAEVRRTTVPRAAPLRGDDARVLKGPGALVAAAARLLHSAMRAPTRPRSEG